MPGESSAQESGQRKSGVTARNFRPLFITKTKLANVSMTTVLYTVMLSKVYSAAVVGVEAFELEIKKLSEPDPLMFGCGL